MTFSVKEFFQGKRFAVVGVSRSGRKFGNTIFSELKTRGYDLFIVHPQQKEIGGEKCYDRIGSLAGNIDGVIVCVDPRKSADVVGEAIRAGVRNIWLQQGAESAEALALARGEGINLVSRKCVLMHAPPVRSYHSLHRAVAKLFGQL
jgi:predicted CoA-binding protein